MEDTKLNFKKLGWSAALMAMGTFAAAQGAGATKLSSAGVQNPQQPGNPTPNDSNNPNNPPNNPNGPNPPGNGPAKPRQPKDKKRPAPKNPNPDSPNGPNNPAPPIGPPYLLHWSMEEPAIAQGSAKDAFCRVRDDIRQKVQAFFDKFNKQHPEFAKAASA
jgi:hypothetical protein